MTEEPMRSREEVTRAHDLLVRLVTDDELRGLLELETLERILWHADVLCWMLHHDHNQNFAVRMATLESSLEELGFKLVMEEESGLAEPEPAESVNHEPN